MGFLDRAREVGVNLDFVKRVFEKGVDWEDIRQFTPFSNTLSYPTSCGNRRINAAPSPKPSGDRHRVPDRDSLTGIRWER